MATNKNARKRWRFSEQKSVDFKILDGNGNVAGNLRIKPSAVLWAPKNSRDYLRIGIENLESILLDPDTPGVTRVKS